MTVPVQHVTLIEARNQLVKAISAALGTSSRMTDVDHAIAALDIAITHERAALQASADLPRFDPSNHHNALACPYCNPEKLVLTRSGSRAPADGREEVNAAFTSSRRGAGPECVRGALPIRVQAEQLFSRLLSARTEGTIKKEPEPLRADTGSEMREGQDLPRRRTGDN